MKLAVLAALLTLTAVTSAHADYIGGSIDQQERCVALFERQNDAFATNRYEEMLAFIQRQISVCSSIEDDQGIAEHYADAATAYAGMRNWSAAVQQSESCLRLDYTNAVCHEEKANALYELERFADARTSAESAIRFAQSNIATARARAESASNPARARLWRAKERMNQIALQAAVRLLETLSRRR